MEYSRINMLLAVIGTIIISIKTPFQEILSIGVVMFAILTAYILLQKFNNNISEMSANVLFMFSLLLLVPYLNIIISLFMYTEIVSKWVRDIIIITRGKK